MPKLLRGFLCKKHERIPLVFFSIKASPAKKTREDSSRVFFLKGLLCKKKIGWGCSIVKVICFVFSFRLSYPNPNPKKQTFICFVDAAGGGVCGGQQQHQQKK